MTRNRFLTLRLVFAISAFLLIGGCESVDSGLLSASNALSSPDPVTGKRELLLLSEEQEIRRADQAIADALEEARQNGHAIDEETPYFERVNAVFQKLLPVVHRQHLPYELHVIDDGVWNAYTPGGGKVVVLSGLFKGEQALQSDDELAAILAHEIAHIAARHVTERGSKIMVTQMVDNDLRSSEFEAAFTTNQEDEADRISVIYSALAGYDPTAAVNLWQRMAVASGSYAGVLADHPLNDDRAANLQSYSHDAWPFYTPGVQRADSAAVLASNPLFSNPQMNSGEGNDEQQEGGITAATNAALNTYLEVLKVKNERYKHEIKHYDQVREASRQLIFQNLRVGNAQGGGKAVWGVSVNATDRDFAKAMVRLRYWNAQTVIHEKIIPWAPLTAGQRFEFGYRLEPIRFTSVTLTPDYVLLDSDDAQSKNNPNAD